MYNLIPIDDLREALTEGLRIAFVGLSKNSPHYDTVFDMFTKDINDALDGVQNTGRSTLTDVFYHINHASANMWFNNPDNYKDVVALYRTPVDYPETRVFDTMYQMAIAIVSTTAGYNVIEASVVEDIETITRANIHDLIDKHVAHARDVFVTGTDIARELWSMMLSDLRIAINQHVTYGTLSAVFDALVSTPRTKTYSYLTTLPYNDVVASINPTYAHTRAHYIPTIVDESHWDMWGEKIAIHKQLVALHKRIINDFITVVARCMTDVLLIDPRTTVVYLSD